MADHSATNSGFVQLSDAQYDFFRAILEKVFPAAGVFYALLGGYFHWNNVVEVTGSLAGAAVFLGVVLSLARRGYTPSTETPPGGFDGAVVDGINEAGEPIVRVQLNETSASDLLNKSQLVIKGYDPSA